VRGEIATITVEGKGNGIIDKKFLKKEKGKKESFVTAAVLEQKGIGINKSCSLKELICLCRSLFVF